MRILAQPHRGRLRSDRYAKASKLGLELQNRAAELELCAERKAGSFLYELRLRGGDRRSETKHSDVKLKYFGINRVRPKY